MVGVEATPDELTKHRAALRRAMPVTRMLDYGMDFWDATQLSDAQAGDPWHEVAVRLAERQVDQAGRAAAAGDVETATAGFRRATAALVFGQMAFNLDTELKRALYTRVGEAYEAAARVDPSLLVERLTIPFDGGRCNAWLVRPRSALDGPIVAIVGGQSGWGPAYHLQAGALAARGLSSLLLELPGQGETRMFGGLHLDADVHRAFSAALDLALRHTGSAGPAGVWGNSLGGLFAARAAMNDDRFGACVVNGAPIRPQPSSRRTASEQSRALLGVGSDAEVGAVFESLWVDPARDRMSAALLVLHGEADPLVTLDQQRPFLRTSGDATLRVWDDGEHTIYNHSAERTEFVSDWFRARLRRNTPSA